MSTSGPSNNGSKEELEELDEGAIIAHQAAPHSPQRRAQVADESRSIVIAEEPAQPASRPYRADRGEKTLVIRDRRDLERARQKILAEMNGKRGLPRAVWFGLAFAVFAIAGSLVIVWVRGPRSELTQVVVPGELAADIKPAAPPHSASVGKAELPTPQISLEQLPLERPRRQPTGNATR